VSVIEVTLAPAVGDGNLIMPHHVREFALGDRAVETPVRERPSGRPAIDIGDLKGDSTPDTLPRFAAAGYARNDAAALTMEDLLDREGVTAS
jgi:hypothetical protein